MKAHILLKETISVSVPLVASPPVAGGGVPPTTTEKITVNFRPELKEIIKETKYLDKMGYSVPEAALNIALQVKNLNNLIQLELY